VPTELAAAAADDPSKSSQGSTSAPPATRRPLGDEFTRSHFRQFGVTARLRITLAYRRPRPAPLRFRQVQGSQYM
jgi:hypothetical protein